MEILQKHQALLTNYEVHLLLRDIAKQENDQRKSAKSQPKNASNKAGANKSAASHDSEKQTSGSGNETDDASKRNKNDTQSAVVGDVKVRNLPAECEASESDKGEASSQLSVSQYQVAPNLATICYELQRYLDEVTESCVLERRNVVASSFQTFNDALRDQFGLTRTERFSIANWLPTTPIDIAALIEDADRRFGNDPAQLEQLVGLVRTHFTGSAEEHATLKAEIERERNALKEPTVKSRSPRKPH